VTFFISNLSIYYVEIQSFVDYINEIDFFGFSISTDAIYTSIQTALSDLSIDDILSSLNAILAVPSAIVNTILAIISAIFMLIEKEKIIKSLHRIIRVFTPTKVSKTILEYAGKLNKNFKKYLYVQTVYGFIFAIASAIVLIIMGSPYWVILTIMLGLSNYIPYIGSIVATIFAVLVIAFTQGLAMAIIATIVIFIIQQLGANILHPKLMGSSFKISPLLVIISVVVGGAISGIFGMIVAIPIAVVIKDMLESITSSLESKRSKMQTSFNDAFDIHKEEKQQENQEEEEK
jgi:predicted PurR-regulated permease PerM